MSKSSFEHITKSRSPNAKKCSESDEIILSVNRKLAAHECGRFFLLRLDKSLEMEINKFCLGSKISVINHLARVGLEKIKEDNKVVII